MRVNHHPKVYALQTRRARGRLHRSLSAGIVVALLCATSVANASGAGWILDQLAGWGFGKLLDSVVAGSVESQAHNNYVQVTKIINNPPPNVDLSEVRRYADALAQIEKLAFRGRIATSSDDRADMVTAIQRIALDMVDLEARVMRLENRVANLEDQVAQNTQDIHEIRTEYDTLLEEQLLRRPLMECSGAFSGQMYIPWSGARARGGAGAQFKYIFQGKYVLGGLGYSFHSLDPGWVHFLYGQIGGQYHWKYVTLSGSFRGGYRFLDNTHNIGPVAFGVAMGFKVYPHHNVPIELELNATQSGSDTSVGFSLGVGTRGEWVAAGVGIAALLALGAASK